jgi:AcrR family transcriptional regulator
MNVTADTAMTSETRALDERVDPSIDPRGDAPVDPRIERTSAAILDASFALLCELGPDGVTHANVAAEARVSRTTVYKHFATRADLLRATIEVYGPTMPTATTGDLRADLFALFRHLVDDLADPERSRLIVTMMERSLDDPIVAQVRDGFVDEARSVVRDAVARGIATGELRRDADADLLVAGLGGLMLYRAYMDGRPVTEDELDRLLDLALAIVSH